MSDVKNPLFENERELLERQKQEYKAALMGDVAQIKTQGQEIGKKVAIAGGVLVAGVLLSRMFSGGDKKKSRKLKAPKDTKQISYSPPVASEPVYQHYNPSSHEQPPVYAIREESMHYQQPHHQTSLAKSFINSEVVQMLTSQLAALLMVYLTKKVEEYLSSVSKNTDIAPAPVTVEDIEATAYYPEKDAL